MVTMREASWTTVPLLTWQTYSPESAVEAWGMRRMEPETWGEEEGHTTGDEVGRSWAAPTVAPVLLSTQVGLWHFHENILHIFSLLLFGLLSQSHPQPVSSAGSIPGAGQGGHLLACTTSLGLVLQDLPRCTSGPRCAPQQERLMKTQCALEESRQPLEESPQGRTGRVSSHVWFGRS